MMKPNNIHRLLDQYLDETLSPGDRSRFEEHLPDCAACRREIDLARRIRDDMKSLPPLQEPEGFLFRLRARLSREHERRPAPWKILVTPWIKGIAATALALPVLIFFLAREPFHEKKILVSDEAKQSVSEKTQPPQDITEHRPAAAARRDKVQPATPLKEKLKAVDKKSEAPAEKSADEIAADPVYRIIALRQEPSRLSSERDSIKDERLRSASRKEEMQALSKTPSADIQADDFKKAEDTESSYIPAMLKRFGARNISVEKAGSSTVYRYRIDSEAQADLEQELSLTHTFKGSLAPGAKKIISVELILKKREP